MPTITGTSGNDTLNGTVEQDEIYGLDGDDIINGGESSSTADEWFDDFLFGGAGNDIIDGGAGRDVIRDEEGDDTVYGGSGEDLLVGAAGNDFYDGGTGGNIDGVDELSYFNALAGIVVDLRLATEQVRSAGIGDAAGIGVDTLVSIERVSGSEFDDVMTAGTTDIIFNGGAGNDQLNGGDGSDTLLGGAGNDILSGGAGFDTVSYYGSASGVHVSLAISGAQNTGDGWDTLADIESLSDSEHNDVLIGNDGDNSLFGFEGNDQLYGGGGNDYLLDALYGNNLLDGGDGDDVLEIVSTFSFSNQLFGGAGNDWLTGGSGDDTLDGGDGSDTLCGGEGMDTASYANAGAGVQVDLSISGPQNTVGAGTDTLDGFEMLVGSDYGDQLTAGAGYITIRGGGGNDTLVSSADGDRLYGEAGDDTFIGGVGNDEFDGGDGVDTVDYSAASAGIRAGFAVGGANGMDRLSNIERIVGSNFDDQLAFTGVMLGGAGDDVYSVYSSNQIVEAANQGFDRVEAWNSHYTLPENVESLSLHFDPYAGATIAPHPATLNGTGNSLDNIIVGSGGTNQLNGLAGSDILTGNLGADTLSGGVGDDSFLDTAAGLNGDTITDFAAGDRIHISDASLAGFNFSLSGNTLTYTGGSLTLTGFTGRLTASAAAGGGVQLTVAETPASFYRAGDFNGDGRDDILWRHDDGTVTDWLGRTDGRFDGNTDDANLKVGPGWNVAGIGDFNGDGRDDVIWRNDNGQMIEWLGQTNGGFLGNASASSHVATSWHVVGVGDFNGDGRDDILWRNDDGTVTNWLGRTDGRFDGNTDDANLKVGANWDVASVGDFNGDGRDDILWRNDSGTLAQWLGQPDGGFLGNAGVNNNVPTSWHVQSPDLWV